MSPNATLHTKQQEAIPCQITARSACGNWFYLHLAESVPSPHYGLENEGWFSANYVAEAEPALDALTCARLERIANLDFDTLLWKAAVKISDPEKRSLHQERIEANHLAAIAMSHQVVKHLPR